MSYENLSKRRVVLSPGKARIDGSFLIVMPYRRPALYYLNGTGAWLYLAIDGSRTTEDMVKLAAQRFPATRKAKLRADVLSFLLCLEQSQVAEFR